MSDWYQLQAQEVLDKLGSDRLLGLSKSEVSRRQEKYGFNKLREKPSKNPALILWEQLIAPLVLLLLATALISVFLGLGFISRPLSLFPQFFEDKAKPQNI